MHFDILIFAIIAAFLIYRLNAVLGTKNGAERQRPNPLVKGDAGAAPVVVPLKPALGAQPFQFLTGFEHIIDSTANAEGKISEGLAEIAAADNGFEINSFMQGARYAFDTIVGAYAAGDRDTLKTLLSPKLYADFDAGLAARAAGGETVSMGDVHKVQAARMIAAHLGGTMAYITVDFDIENADARDIWTFTRDIRSNDPNWVLIETKAVDK
jgi:predicted lipid-binding transport protein (Tim44 family)